MGWGWAFIIYWREALAGWRHGHARCDWRYLIKRVEILTMRLQLGDNRWQAVWIPRDLKPEPDPVHTPEGRTDE